jgi:amidohydrolase
MIKLTDIEQSINREMVDVWHHLHQHPELSMQEYQTAQYIENFLRETVKTAAIKRVDKTGLWVQLVGTAPRTGDEPIIILRGDMDALPIQENNDLPFKSLVPGVMHACGHDVHTTSLLGAVRVLEQYRDKIPGTIWFFFQPGEETIKGAKTFLADPDIDLKKAKAIAGVHIGTNVEVGKVRLREGVSMAGIDVLRFKITGKGGRGAAPEEARDPVVASAFLITQLQTLISREVAAVDTAVLSLCSIHGGAKDNIIPQEVLIDGTLRSLEKETRKHLREGIRRICDGVELSMRVAIDFDIIDSSLPLYNDPGCVKIAEQAVKKLLGEDCVVWGKAARMGGEDFAFFTDIIPGVFIIIGAKTIGGRETSNHALDFYTDEGAVRSGILCLCGFALEYFGIPF